MENTAATIHSPRGHNPEYGAWRRHPKGQIHPEGDVANHKLGRHAGHDRAGHLDGRDEGHDGANGPSRVAKVAPQRKRQNRHHQGRYKPHNKSRLCGHQHGLRSPPYPVNQAVAARTAPAMTGAGATPNQMLAMAMIHSGT